MPQTYRLVLLLLAGSLLFATSPARAEPAADRILKTYVEAVGGSGALARIQSRQFKTTLSSGLLRMKVDSRLVRPNLFEEQSTFLGFSSSNGHDGRTGWNRKRGKTEIVQGVELARMLRGHSLDWDQQLQRWYPTRQRLADAEVAGVKVQVVELTAATGEKEIWRFDAATGLLKQIEGFKFEKDKPPVKIVSSLDDYRKVDGVLLPHRMTATDGKREFLIVMSDLVHNQVKEPIRLPAGD
ncbi:MAG: hypothetical protein V4650_12065 [Pseudomonadota bacterium]